MTANDQITRRLEAEWCRTLDVAEARDEDNFFDLGGDSISAVRMIKSVENSENVKFPLEVFFLDGTLGGLKRAGWSGVQA